MWKSLPVNFTEQISEHVENIHWFLHGGNSPWGEVVTAKYCKTHYCLGSLWQYTYTVMSTSEMIGSRSQRLTNTQKTNAVPTIHVRRWYGKKWRGYRNVQIKTMPNQQSNKRKKNFQLILIHFHRILFTDFFSFLNN